MVSAVMLFIAKRIYVKRVYPQKVLRLAKAFMQSVDL